MGAGVQGEGAASESVGCSVRAGAVVVQSRQLGHVVGWRWNSVCLGAQGRLSPCGHGFAAMGLPVPAAPPVAACVPRIKGCRR